MGMSIQEQWKQVKNTVAEGLKNVEISLENQKYNNHYLNIANTFNKEMYHYFEDVSCKENSLTQCTQAMWYRLYLERKRLQNLGLRKIYNRVHFVQCKKDSHNKELVTIGYEDDGKNTMCEICDNSNAEENFFYVNDKNQKVKFFTGKKRKEYRIISSKFKTEKECACQNCGAFMSIEKLIDGCDYCGTKYTLQDLQGKVSSVYEKNNNTQTRTGSPILFIMLSAICFVFAFFLPIVSLLGFLFLIIAMVYIKNNGQKTTESMLKLKEQFQLLSKEGLFSEIENKVFTLHYCDEQKGRQALCECELGVDYKNVLLCETEKFFIEEVNFTPDNNWLSLKCRMHLRVTSLQQEQIVQEKEVVILKMKRSVESLRKINSDLLVYKCKNCGSSISLLNGGICEYCGSKILLENFDWKVTEYQSNWKK